MNAGRGPRRDCATEQTDIRYHVHLHGRIPALNAKEKYTGNSLKISGATNFVKGEKEIGRSNTDRVKDLTREDARDRHFAAITRWNGGKLTSKKIRFSFANFVY